jgi:hypothetical protein
MLIATSEPVAAELTRRAAHRITSTQGCAFSGTQGLMAGMGEMIPQQRTLPCRIASHQNARRSGTAVRPKAWSPPTAADHYR